MKRDRFGEAGHACAVCAPVPRRFIGEAGAECGLVTALPVERISEMRLIRKSEMRLGEGAAAMSAIQQILLHHPPGP